MIATRSIMTIATLLGLLMLPTKLALAFDIYALGTSATNCRKVMREESFTVALEKNLRADGYTVYVVNGGIDGDVPGEMLQRLQRILAGNSEIKLVLFEPGPNDLNKVSNVEHSEKILAYLQSIKMPTVYISNGAIQTNADAEETAKKYGAYYYGHWTKDVPVDWDHRMYDTPVGKGHMTGKGCMLWGKNMTPFVEQVVKEQKIK